MDILKMNGKLFILDDEGIVLSALAVPRRTRIDPQLLLSQLKLVYNRNYEAYQREHPECSDVEALRRVAMWFTLQRLCGERKHLSTGAFEKLHNILMEWR